jgi:hypothetical protein
MFRNCYKFHDPKTDFHRHAKELEEILDKKLEIWMPDMAYDQTISDLPAIRKRG